MAKDNKRDIVRAKQGGARTTSRFGSRLPRTIVVLLIRGYQKTLSPDHGYFRRYYPGGYCRYQPTCSEYGAASVDKYGVVRGGLRSIWRILRCNPWSRGGLDLP